MSQDKFLIYLIKRGVNSIDRLYADTKGIKDILPNRTKNRPKVGYKPIRIPPRRSCLLERCEG